MFLVGTRVMRASLLESDNANHWLLLNFKAKWTNLFLGSLIGEFLLGFFQILFIWMNFSNKRWPLIFWWMIRVLSLILIKIYLPILLILVIFCFFIFEINDF
jgi:hypothetical protein